MSERDMEKPAPDSEDQQWAEDTEAAAEKEPAELPLDVDEADAAEQRREVNARRGRLPLTAEFAPFQQTDRRP